jgi:DegV family protein with EDD domain
MTERINGYHLYQAFLSGYIQISSQREKMNRINVFPVQDGDTGSNMVGTLKTVAIRLRTCRSAGMLLERIADLSLEGARGNSGMILSQYLNEIARLGSGKAELSLCELGDILRRSVDEAYRSVEVPREGTMLSVLRVWAEEVRSACTRHGMVWHVMKDSLEKAKMALAKTPDQLPILKKHHVVDAGALGIVSFLEGVVGLGARGKIPFVKRSRMLEGFQISDEYAPTEHNHDVGQSLNYRYCTEVLLETESCSRNELKKMLSPQGDSLIVTEGVRRKRIHIHTDDPGEVVSILRKQGKIVQQKADDMKRQEQIVTAPLGSIGVVTDSIADIPMELLDKYQVHTVHMSLIWDQEEYLDRLTITPEEFYHMQSERNSFPGSSFPSASQVERYYQYLLEHYEGLIVLPVGKVLSGMWKRMSLSAERFNEKSKRITVVDTRLNSVAQGLLVKRIAREAAKGRNLEELTALAEELRDRIKIFVSVKTFKYMVKGGRVSPFKGFIAKMLNLKPIVSLDSQGKGIAFEKSFSSRGLMKKIAHIMDDINKERGIEEYAIVHASDRERGEEFSSLLSQIVDRKPSYITDISPIVGMHSGKGAVAIGVIEGSKRD